MGGAEKRHTGGIGRYTLPTRFPAPCVPDPGSRNHTPEPHTGTGRLDRVEPAAGAGAGNGAGTAWAGTGPGPGAYPPGDATVHAQAFPPGPSATSFPLTESARPDPGRAGMEHQ